mgnify:FL=1
MIQLNESFLSGALQCLDHFHDIFLSWYVSLIVLWYASHSMAGGIDVVLDSWAINLRKNLKILCNGGLLLYVDVHGFSLEVLQIDSLMSKNANIQGILIC